MVQTAFKDVYTPLSNFMKAAPNFDTNAKLEIEAFFAGCVADMDTDSEKLLATLFIKALNKKIHSEFIGENIYLGKYDISQIQLFNILIEQFPFVKYSQQITNQAIIAEMQDSAEVTLIDIGIGQGTQVLNIIELAKTLPQLKSLHIVGIEPFGDALEKAAAQITAQNDQTSFDLQFTGIHDSVEKLELQAIPNLKGKIIVNASLALHHIQSEALRLKTIARVKALNPSAFILIEPNVNHYEPDFYKRFQSSYQHFNHIFKVIDRIENIGNDDKNALKLFFGREIEDIIGKEEKDRFEKHEPATHWIKRLKAQDFTLKSDFLPAQIPATCGVEIKYHKEGFLGFTHIEETVLAIIYAN